MARDLAPHSSKQVVDNCVQLADALRAAGTTVVFVHVDIDAVPHSPADKPRAQPPQPLPGTASDLLPTLGIQPTDKIVLKHQFGAFWNTDLHDYLQSQGI